jgi:hypothetical protein
MRDLGLATAGELAERLSVDLKVLDPTIRKQVLFWSDEDCYAKAKKASDGFEHAFLPLDEVHRLAAEVRDRTGEHLRRGLLVLAGIDEPALSELLGPKLAQPMTFLPIVKYLRGALIGAGEPAAAGERYPFVVWQLSVKGFRAEGDRQDVTWDETMTPRMGEGIQFRPVTVEMWSANPVTASVSNRRVTVVSRPPESSAAASWTQRFWPWLKSLWSGRRS